MQVLPTHTSYTFTAHCGEQTTALSIMSCIKDIELEAVFLNKSCHEPLPWNRGLFIYLYSLSVGTFTCEQKYNAVVRLLQL